MKQKICPECNGNLRVPHKGIWTKICPTCYGKPQPEEKPAQVNLDMKNCNQKNVTKVFVPIKPTSTTLEQILCNCYCLKAHEQKTVDPNLIKDQASAIRHFLREKLEGMKKSGCGLCESNCLTDKDIIRNQALDDIKKII